MASLAVFNTVLLSITGLLHWVALMHELIAIWLKEANSFPVSTEKEY